MEYVTVNTEKNRSGRHVKKEIRVTEDGHLAIKEKNGTRKFYLGHEVMLDMAHVLLGQSPATMIANDERFQKLARMILAGKE